jgi:uncharacterized protein YoaH (UPF0181 family)
MDEAGLVMSFRHEEAAEAVEPIVEEMASIPLDLRA